MTWILKFQCPFCNEIKVVKSDPNFGIKDGETKKTIDQLSITDSAVWGFASIGSGHCNLEEAFSIMGIKPVDVKTFRKSEEKIGKVCGTTSILNIRREVSSGSY